MSKVAAGDESYLFSAILLYSADAHASSRSPRTYDRGSVRGDSGTTRQTRTQADGLPLVGEL